MTEATITIGIDHVDGDDVQVIAIPTSIAHRAAELEAAAEEAGHRVRIVVMGELPSVPDSFARAVRRLDQAVATQTALAVAAGVALDDILNAPPVRRLHRWARDDRPSPESEEGRQRLAAAEAKRARRRERRRRANRRLPPT